MMMTNRARRLFALVVAACGFLVSLGAEPEIVAKARAYLGPEAALNAVTSIRYVGKLAAAEATPNGPKNNEAAVEIIFQKPNQHRITTTTPTRIEVAALNDYEGWQRQQDSTDASKWRLTLLSRDQIKRLRANTWENLAFFHGLEQHGGKIEDLGDVTLEGVACRKVAFQHDESIVFFRYFDKATGRLVLTETEQGGTIREQGEIIANGIRFPQVIVTTLKGPDGKEIPVTVTLDKVILNEKFPEETFAIPMPGSK
jgi:hypothetical protein